MSVYILGCDHWLQPYDLCEPMPQFQEIERQLKQRFYSIVEELIKTQNIASFGEECKRNQRTIPQALAEENGCQYVEIDMPIWKSDVGEAYRRITTRSAEKQKLADMISASSLWSRKSYPN